MFFSFIKYGSLLRWALLFKFFKCYRKQYCEKSRHKINGQPMKSTLQKICWPIWPNITLTFPPQTFVWWNQTLHLLPLPHLSAVSPELFFAPVHQPIERKDKEKRKSGDNRSLKTCRITEDKMSYYVNSFPLLATKDTVNILKNANFRKAIYANALIICSTIISLMNLIILINFLETLFLSYLIYFDVHL